MTSPHPHSASLETQYNAPTFTQISVGRRTYLILYLKILMLRNKRHSPLHVSVSSIQLQGIFLFLSENILNLYGHLGFSASPDYLIIEGKNWHP